MYWASQGRSIGPLHRGETAKRLLILGLTLAWAANVFSQPLNMSDKEKLQAFAVEASKPLIQEDLVTLLRGDFDRRLIERLTKTAFTPGGRDLGGFQIKYMHSLLRYQISLTLIGDRKDMSAQEYHETILKNVANRHEEARKTGASEKLLLLQEQEMINIRAYPVDAVRQLLDRSGMRDFMQKLYSVQPIHRN